MFHLILDWLTASQDFFRQLGWWGVAVYAGLIVLLQLFLAPLSPVAITGGFIFGMGGGWLAITAGTGIGAAINFLISRYLARGFVQRRMAKNEKFRLIDQAIGREGWRIVALLRFCPIPYGFANYAYGLTAIRFWPYLWTTLITIIPANLFFVWLGSSAQSGLESLLGNGRPRHPFEYALLAFGLLAGFLALRKISQIARRAIATPSPVETVSIDA